jgi:hypothetical protein
VSTLSTTRPPLISVAIPTRDRADLLERSLESLDAQTLSREDFEIVIVDDGSTDGTRALCKRFSEILQLRYQRLTSSGIAAAKNAGLFASAGWIVLFFDDDDAAHPDLLNVHVAAHKAWPETRLGILGYTTWHPSLEITPLMDDATEVGQYLFSYPSVEAGKELDFTHFWGGRASVKRSFLLEHGAFNQDFTFGYEDIELGFRLSKHGFAIVYEPKAISYSLRPVTPSTLLRRYARQQESLAKFRTLHSNSPRIAEYCAAQELGLNEAIAGLSKSTQAHREASHVKLGGHTRGVNVIDNSEDQLIALSNRNQLGPVGDDLGTEAAVEAVLADPPLPHVFQGKPHLWALSDEALVYLAGAVHSHQSTLETGAGISTVVFALCGSRHTAITPSEHEVQSLREYCRAKSVPLDCVEFRLGPSEIVLPPLVEDSPPLDIALIDGRHGFPAPFIDWFYIDRLLQVNGLLVVDDCHLWTPGVLREFLEAEEKWSLERNFGDRTCVFRKLALSSSTAEWNEQPFVNARSLPSPGGAAR